MMMDVAAVIPAEQRYGNEITFTGFSDESIHSRIDFIFARKKDCINYATHGVMANRFDDGIFLSDHRACVADFQLLPDDGLPAEPAALIKSIEQVILLFSRQFISLKEISHH
jgi:hypothetical protein